jgi:hemolysin activation/secretion protein
MAFNTKNVDGLGGFHTFRGFKRNRFVGDSAVLVSSELRWSFTEWEFWGQLLRPMLAPFTETGRVHDDVELSLVRWRVSYGIGFRLAWNLSTIVSFDYGTSGEDRVFYLELDHTF